jgi:hypothetical protein
MMKASSSLGKQNVIARSNDAYGIPERVYVTNVSKAVELDPAKLEAVTDPYTAMSLRLQAAFGIFQASCRLSFCG